MKTVIVKRGLHIKVNINNLLYPLVYINLFSIVWNYKLTDAV